MTDTAVVSTVEQLVRRMPPDAAAVELMLDPNVARTPIAAQARDCLDRHLPGTKVRSRTVGGDCTLDTVEVISRELEPGSIVLGVGGGAVIDHAKLASLVASHPRAVHSVARAGRSGFVMLPSQVRRRFHLALVPTTIGTGAESSRSACLRLGDRKRLVFGEALRADAAALDPAATATLPVWQLIEGCLEAMLRITSYYVGHQGAERDEADHAAEAVLAGLVEVGFELVDHLDAGRPVPADVRSTAARLSNLSHSSLLQAGLESFSDRTWPLANELSTAARVRKLTALALVAPAVWRRTEQAGSAWGAAHRLERVWAVIRSSATTEMPPEAPRGLVQLMDLWQVDRSIGPVDWDDIAHATARAWSHGLPMLRGISEDELRVTYALAADTTHEPSTTTRGRR